MSLSFEKNQTQEGQARQLARHMPEGRVWANKFRITSTLGKLTYALSGEWLRFQQLVSKVLREADINQTSDLIEEWEKSVGIPNAYFSNVGVSIERRRLQVLLMLTDFGGAQTEEDFERIAELFGFTDVTVRNGNSALFPISFPLLFFSGDGKTARHTIFVTLPSSALVFPLAFPLQFSADSGFILERIFRALLPANVDVQFLFGDV